MAKCEHSGPNGMCRQDALPGLSFCEKHADKKAVTRGYRFSDPELLERLDWHSRAELIESVRQEVVLVRGLMEERRELARTPAEKVSAFPVIIQATATLDRLVNSLAKLEKQSGLVLEKSAIEKLGRRIVEILMDNLKDVPDRDNLIDRIAREIAEAVTSAKNITEE